MDKKAIGEQIVTNIINSYILSNDFEEDAVHYIYKKIFDEYNSLVAQCGFDFEANRITKEEFLDRMKNLSENLKSFRETFKLFFNYAPEYKDIINVTMDIYNNKKK